MLNMSQVDIQLLDQQRVHVTAQLDLTRAFGSTADYFAASQIAQPLLDARVAEQLRLAASGIELRAGDIRVHLTPVHIVFARQTLAEYESPLEWPRATVQFEGQMNSDLQPAHNAIRVRFDDRFVFEEPIATTLQYAKDDLIVSRWLVTFQSSPLLAAPGWFASDYPEPALASALEVSSSGAEVFSRYFGLGFWHILPDGIDHLLFLLAIVLGLPTVRGLFLSLSLYTAAHSLSFAAATLGWLPSGIPGVELMIALSIVISAAMNFWSREGVAGGNSVMTFAFGLLHGLGFASALTGAGLPTEQRLAGLLGFNFGVEAAQLLCVALLLPVWWCRRFAWYRGRILWPLSLAIVLVVVSWWWGL